MTQSRSEKAQSKRRVWKAQALATWDILTLPIPIQEIFYAEFSEKLLGRRAPRAVSKPLGLVLTFCQAAELPLLSAIVVTKRTRKPSELAPYDSSKVDADIAEVRRTDWSAPEFQQREAFSRWLDQKYSL